MQKTPTVKIKPREDLDTLRKRINLSIAKAKFKALAKAEQEKRANQAIKNIKQLIKC